MILGQEKRMNAKRYHEDFYCTKTKHVFLYDHLNLHKSIKELKQSDDNIHHAINLTQSLYHDNKAPTLNELAKEMNEAYKDMQRSLDEFKKDW